MITIATFPRSGHHWLMNMTQDACKLPTGWHTDLHRSQPGRECLVLKTHDFDMQHESADLVQWRDPILALISWFELGVSHGNWNDTKESWIRFSSQQILFAADFYNKWVGSRKCPVIYYENLVADPECFVDELALMINKHVIRQVKADEARPRITSAFKYFDQQFMEGLRYTFEELTR